MEFVGFVVGGFMIDLAPDNKRCSELSSLSSVEWVELESAEPDTDRQWSVVSVGWPTLSCPVRSTLIDQLINRHCRLAVNN